MIGIGNDHAGTTLKLEIIKHLEEQGIEYIDYGVAPGEAIDYPDAAERVCRKVVDGTCDKAILICGTGIGISIAANKIKGIRACACSDTFSAKYTRLHNDANALSMRFSPGTYSEYGSKCGSCHNGFLLSVTE